MHFEPNLACPLKRLLRHLLGAPSDVFEHASVSLLEPKQVIAAVRRWPQDGTTAGPCQDLGGLDQQGRWQRRTVGIQYGYGAVTARQHRFDREQEAIAEVRPPRADQADIPAERAFEESF